MTRSPRRRCTRCKRYLAEHRFNWKRKSLGHRQSYCRDCGHQYHKEWYEKNKEQRKAQIYAYKAQRKAAREVGLDWAQSRLLEAGHD